MTRNLMYVFLPCFGVAVFLPIQAPAQALSAPVGRASKPSSSTTRDPAQQAVKPAESGQNRGIPDQYIIGEGDVLQVSVWKEPDASVPGMVVRADGKITLPFVKEITVSGLTAAQAEEMIAAKLKPFITDPDVTLVVREVHSKKIYLIGAVRRTGAVEMSHPMTVLQALTEAGGPNDFAKKKNIYILRMSNGKQVRLPFNYEAVIRGEQAEQNYWLMPNDMVVVPQ